MHALIIEQDYWIILMIEDVLRELGFTSFDSAASVEVAILSADRNCPDLITADLRLDTGTGVEAVRRICSEAPVPVVFITATPWELEAHEKERVIVPKPFDSAGLKAGVAKARRQTVPGGNRMRRSGPMRGNAGASPIEKSR